MLPSPMYFFENSTRTRLSFELAQKRLSADVINFSASNSSVKKGETLLDTVNNILAMKVDMIVMRHASPGAPHFLSKHIKANIINAGDGTHEHPTQALLDAFSIREKLGSVSQERKSPLSAISFIHVSHSQIFSRCKNWVQKSWSAVRRHCFQNSSHNLGVEVEFDVKKALQWCDVANVLTYPTGASADKILSFPA